MKPAYEARAGDDSGPGPDDRQIGTTVAPLDLAFAIIEAGTTAPFAPSAASSVTAPFAPSAASSVTAPPRSGWS